MSKIQMILVCLTLLLGVVLRFHNYTLYPQRGATSDEYTYAFMGVSLLKDHIPISWSSFPEYKQRWNLTINGIYFPMVKPYFDHPPLNGLLVGAWALAFGQSTYSAITLPIIRLVPILLGTLASLLLFLVTKRSYPFAVALWSVLIYNTTSFFIMNMRVVVAENLLTVLFLLALLIFPLQKEITTRQTILLGILAGLALWTKILGVTVFLSLLLLLFVFKQKKQTIILFSAVFVTFFLLLLGYAAVYDFNLFLAIQHAQSSRMAGPETLWLLTTSSTIVNKVIADGWYFLGIISILFLIISFSKHMLLLVPPLVYFLCLLLSITNSGHSGWYLIPLFPFFSFAISYLAYKSIKEKNGYFFVFLLFCGLTAIQYIYKDIFGLDTVAFRVLIALFFIPPLLTLVYKKGAFFEVTARLWFYAIILLNVIQTWRYIHPA